MNATQTESRWQTTKQAGIECAVCGKSGTCTVAPDRTAFKCWKDGGKVHQMNGHSGNGKGNGYIGKAHRKTTGSPRTFSTAKAAIDAAGMVIAGAEFTAEWTYANVAGRELMRVARFDLPDGSKEFRPVHLSNAGWKIGDPTGPLPLYHLPELPETGTVYVCEGEKATDAARAIKLHATTSAHGASSADKTDWKPLADRDVVILPDNDDAGRKYARSVVTILVGAPNTDSGCEMPPTMHEPMKPALSKTKYAQRDWSRLNRPI